MNLLLLTFHMKQPNKTTTVLLYCLMNGTDLLICFLMIPAVISCWSGSEPLLFKTRVAREIWLFIWEVSGRMSVFLIGLQSVLRTRALLFPFSRRPNIKTLAAIIMVYMTILCSIQSVHFFYNVYSIFSPNTNRSTMVMVWIQRAMGLESAASITFLVLNNLFGYVAPFLSITISCVISVYCIRKSGSGVKRCGPVGTDRQHHQTATITVILLTLVYIVTNALTFVLELNEMLASISKILKKTVRFINWRLVSPLHYAIVYVTSYNVCILLNSTLNGFVFLIRTATIKEFMVKSFQNIWRTLHKNKDEPDMVLSNRSIVAETEVSRTDTLAETLA